MSTAHEHYAVGVLDVRVEHSPSSLQRPARPSLHTPEAFKYIMKEKERWRAGTRLGQTKEIGEQRGRSGGGGYRVEQLPGSPW